MIELQGKHKKICIVTISLGKGGAERSCAMLSQMLSEMGHEVHLALLNDSISYPYSGNILNLGLLKKGKDTWAKRLKRFRIFRAFIKENEFDYIIDQRSKNQYFRELFYHKYLYYGVQTIYVTHSSNKEGYLTQYPKKFAKICNRNFANVAVSKYIEEHVLKATGIQETTTIQNAYDPLWFENGVDEPQVFQNMRYILSYGRIVDSIKDFTFLIHAFEASRIWEQNVSLVIMGDGPDKEKLTRLAQTSKASTFIHFLPFHSSPFSIIKNATFVTLTSRYEGFPMVLIESLSLGTPVVSLDIISGPDEIIEPNSNGLLIKERSIPLFAAAMEKMITDTDLYQRCKRNAMPSVKRFSMAEIAKKWNDLLSHEE